MKNGLYYVAVYIYTHQFQRAKFQSKLYYVYLVRHEDSACSDRTV